MLIQSRIARVAAAALILLASIGILEGCSNAPVVETQPRMIAPRILPSARGYVVCADCDNFLPTPKHIKTAAAPVLPAKAVTAEPSVVPVTLSVVAGEQIVSLPKKTVNTPESTSIPSPTSFSSQSAIAPFATAATTPPAARTFTILFMRGQAGIGRVEARKLRASLQTVNADSTYVIRGYTDATGSPLANHRLASLRAAAVKTFVIRDKHATRVSIDATVACCEGSIHDPETVRAKQRRADMDFF